MHFGINFKRSTVRKANLCLFSPPSFLCFHNKDSISHPITSCPSPAMSPICPTTSPIECVTQWDCWDTLIARLSTLIFCCYCSVSPTKLIKWYIGVLHSAYVYVCLHCIVQKSWNLGSLIRQNTGEQSVVSRQTFSSSFGTVYQNLGEISVQGVRDRTHNSHCHRWNPLFLLFIFTLHCSAMTRYFSKCVSQEMSQSL